MYEGNNYLTEETEFQRSAISKFFYQKGFQLFEEGKYLEAISAYKYCIAEDPTDVPVRFEIAEAYLEIGRFSEAKRELNDLVPYVRNDFDKAHYYRRIGYMAIDEHDYEFGGACMLLSLKYYDYEGARGELQYIESVTGIYPNYTEEEIIQILTDRKVQLW